MSGWARPRALTLAGLFLGLVAVIVPGRALAVGEDPAAELAEALRGLGAPGMVWGRLAVEEESPVGPWTPLDGIEVTLYPSTPTLIAELDRIRQSARTSSAQYESAIGRVLAALAAHKSRVERLAAPLKEPELVAEPPIVWKPQPDRASPSASLPSGVAATAGSTTPAGGPVESSPEGIRVWRQKTDPAGLFAFDGVPAGDWIVVVFRASPYGTEKARSDPKLRQPGRAQRFLPRAIGPAKEGELWITRIRVVAGERVGLELTDRARWMAGPVR